MSPLPAPNGGSFVLTRPINPAVCPGCGARAAALWNYTDPAAPTTVVPVACEGCAGSAKEDTR